MEVSKEAETGDGMSAQSAAMAPRFLETLGITRASMSFYDCVMACLEEPELIANFERLYGVKIVERRSPIEQMVDKACGREPGTEGMAAFVEFVHECVWTRFAPVDATP